MNVQSELQLFIVGERVDQVVGITTGIQGKKWFGITMADMKFIKHIISMRNGVLFVYRSSTSWVGLSSLNMPLGLPVYAPVGSVMILSFFLYLFMVTPELSVCKSWFCILLSLK